MNLLENVVHINNGVLLLIMNEIMSFSEKWMELEIIMLNKISHPPQSQVLLVSSHLCKLRKKCMVK
jgi:hypothetical protein